MTALILMRHGHALSCAESGAAEDGLRPLSEQGRADAAAAANYLAKQNLKPDAIICSPLLRARETAEIAATEFGLSTEEAQALSGEAGLEEMWSAIAEKLRQTPLLLAISHQPLIGMLAGVLAGEGMRSFQPAGFSKLVFAQIPGELKRGCAVEELLVIDPAMLEVM